jgi:DNA polymerase (family 10)
VSLNRTITDALHEIAALHELLGADAFRVRAYSRAARAFESLPTDAAEMSRQDLLQLEGVGHKMVDKVEQLRDTGSIDELIELRAKVPEGLPELLRIQGLGPKTVRAVWQHAGVESVEDLQKAIAEDRLKDVPRLGAKTIENIARALDFAKHSSDRARLGVAVPLAELIIEALEDVPGVRRLEAAGSLRRGKETVGDLDILAVADDPDRLAAAFRELQGVTDVLASGETKTSVRMMVPVRRGPATAIQVDLRVVPEASFGAALLYFTGSKEHNIRLRERARKKKLTLNEYGLFPDEPGDGPPQSRGVEPVASESEEEIYAALDLPYLPPEIREDRGEIELTETPRLIELSDITSELHAHTTASDGAMSIRELAELARERGFHTIAVTDHSKSQAVASGLSEERLRKHIAAIREANEQIEGIAILAGSEVDILADGDLDYGDELLAELDVVVASPHWALQQKPQKATERLLKAIEHPLVRIIGHPTGRLINRRSGLEPAMDEIIAAAIEHDTALEINAHWARLDLRDHHVRAAVEAGALIAIDCDVHGAGDYENIRFGVATARRGWLAPERCVNTWDAERLHAWLARTASPAGSRS